MDSRGIGSSGNGFNANSSNNNFMKNTSLDYGQQWLVNEAKSLRELGDNDIKLRYLEKSLKSQRRILQRNAQRLISSNDEGNVNEKFKLDKNAIVGRKFPFRADEFKYPNDGKEKPKSLYIKYNDEYGSKKPNELELADKYFPINNTFTKEFNQIMHKNFSLNTAQSRSKVHAKLDSVV